MVFRDPAAFLLLICILPAWYFRYRKKGGKQGALFSDIRFIKKSGISFRQRLLIIQPVLFIAALFCITIAIARPQFGREEIREKNRGIAIEMVIDRSGSMGAEIRYAGKTVNRLEAVKEVFTDFVYGDGKSLTGRLDDLIGVIVFARYSDTLYPLSVTHKSISSFLDSVSIVSEKGEDGTAVGDALALASARLAEIDASAEYTVKSKIIILLTDGRNNTGERTPKEAAELAAAWGIKIYTIGIGGEGDFITINTPLGKRKIPAGASLDRKTLQELADLSGGIYFEAESAGDLREIYKAIDQLEKSEIESAIYVDYKEAFIPFAAAGIFLLSLFTLLSATVFRRSP